MANEIPEATQTQGEGVVSENNAPLTAVSQVEDTGSKPEDTGASSNGEKRGGPDPYFAAKRVNDKLARRLDKLEELIQGLQHQPNGDTQSPAPKAESQAPDVWTDPDTYFDTRMEKALAKERLANARRDAEEYVLSQEDIDPDRDYDELQKISKQYRLDEIAKSDPYAAADALLDLYRAKKGLSVRKESPPKAQAMSVQGSPNMVPGKKVWTRAEISQIAGTPEYEKHREDILAAGKEGRIR